MAAFTVGFVAGILLMAAVFFVLAAIFLSEELVERAERDI